MQKRVMAKQLQKSFPAQKEGFGDHMLGIHPYANPPVSASVATRLPYASSWKHLCRIVSATVDVRAIKPFALPSEAKPTIALLSGLCACEVTMSGERPVRCRQAQKNPYLDDVCKYKLPICRSQDPRLLRKDRHEIVIILDACHSNR